LQEVYYTHLLQSCDRQGNGTERAIYICRDPRDVVVSAANYFTFRERPGLHAGLGRLPSGLRLYYALYEREPYRLARALDALLQGGERQAWRAHIAVRGGMNVWTSARRERGHQSGD